MIRRGTCHVSRMMARGRRRFPAVRADGRRSQQTSVLATQLSSKVPRRRGRRGPGISIIPARVREARAERGLSLAELAGTEVSRAFIHQLEQGLARPSLEILELIAERTGKPVDFFTSGEVASPHVASDLPGDVMALAKRLERAITTLQASEANREAFRLLVSNLRHGARLLSAVIREQQPPDPDP